MKSAKVHARRRTSVSAFHMRKNLVESVEPRLLFAGFSLGTVISLQGNSGAQPIGGVIFDSTGNMYGTTFFGGSSGKGTVFEIVKGASKAVTVASFTGDNGAGPKGTLAFNSAGDLVGTTYNGGSSDQGTIFRIPKNTSNIQTMASFTGANGANPFTGVVFDSHGNIFGTTEAGGSSGKGTVYEILATDSTNTIHTVASFNGTNGTNPDSPLILDASENLHGTTNLGGANNLGTVFEIANGANTIQTIASFNGTNGREPIGPLAFDAQSNLVGATFEGGANNLGTVFKVDHVTGAISTVASFSGTNSSNPVSGVFMTSNGDIFGSTTGVNDGTVFKIPNNTANVQTIATFTGANGSGPSAVTVNAAGDVFGTGFSGGAFGAGNVFKVVSNSGNVTDLFSFDGNKNLSSPSGSVIFDNAGTLYATSQTGGERGFGAVFQVSKGATTPTVRATFDFSNNGSSPSAGLTFDKNGNLYGTTATGGNAHDDGTVFRLDNGATSITQVAVFNNNNGNHSLSKVVFDKDGNLFGTTLFGGANGIGSVFEIASGSTAITTVFSFSGADGQNPRAGLAINSDGNLFGTTSSGGANGKGTVFEITGSGHSFQNIASFNGTNGNNPISSIAFDSHGNLIGTTQAGGANGLGTVFRILKNTTTIQTLGSFNGTNGATPVANVTIDDNDNIFGTTAAGGTGGFGTVFEIPSTGGSGVQTLLNFNKTNGADPEAGLTFDPDGNLWGTARAGGTNKSGVLFELTPDIATGNDTLDIGGLRFLSLNGGFDANHNAFGTVQVGFTPTSGSFVPLLELTGTTSVSATTFSATGTVSALIGGTKTKLFDSGVTVNIGQLLGTGVTETNASTFSVAGATFTLNSLRFANAANPQIQLQGSLALPQGLTIAVADPNVVTFSSAGIGLTGASFAITSSFKVNGASFSTDDLTVAYSSSGNVFSITGGASVAVTGLANLDVEFTGNGFVIANGAFSGFAASIDSSIKVGGVTFLTKGLNLNYDASAQKFSLGGVGGVAAVAGVLITGLGASSSSFKVTFGSAANPGITIANGKLTLLDVTVNTDFTVANVKIKATNLHLTYVAATDTVTLTGQAGVVVGGIVGDTAAENSIKVDFGFTDPTTGAKRDGLVVTAGKLVSLDMRVDADFTIAGVKIKADGLEFAYAAATATAAESFSMSGTAGVVVKGMAGTGAENSFSVTFGDKDSTGHKTPGVQVLGGKLAKLDVSVTGQFSVGGVTIKATALRFTYTAATATVPESFTLSGSAGVAVKGITGSDGGSSFAVKFGFTDASGKVNPGLVVTNTAQGAKLTKLDVTVDASIKVAKVTIFTKGLRFTFTAGQDATPTTPKVDEVFTLTGTAGVVVAGVKRTQPVNGPLAETSFSVTFADKGLVIRNGTLDSLDVSVDTAFSVSSVNFTLDKLRFQYFSAQLANGSTPARAEMFTLSGTAGVRVTKIDAGLSVTFGHTNADKSVTPGLVVTDGKLQNLEMTINADFTVQKVLTVAIKDLEFSYTAATDTFAISGTASVSPKGLSDLASLDVSLGEPASTDPAEKAGILITGGQLVSLSMMVDAHFNIAVVRFTGNLALKYTAIDNKVVITGKAAASIGEISTVNVNLGLPSPTTGKLTDGLVLTVPSAATSFSIDKFNMVATGDLTIAGIKLNANLVMAFVKASATAPSMFTMSGGASLTVPSVGAVKIVLGGTSGTAGLVVIDGKLQRLDALLDGQFKIGPVSLTGLVKLEYLADNGGRFAMFGNADLSVFDTKLFSVTMGSATAPGILFQRGTLQKLNLAATGTISILGVPLASVSLATTYDAARRAFTFTGGAGLTLPNFIPDWLASAMGASNRVLASITINLSIIDGDKVNSFVEALATAGGGTFGFKVDFNGHVTFEPTSNPVAVVLNAVGKAMAWLSSWFGPLEGATVFYDASGRLTLSTDPHVNTGASSGVSPTNGQFPSPVPVGSTGGQLVLTGGTDVSTGLANRQMITAPFDSEVISPLTSIVNQLMIQNGFSESDANTLVDRALGIADTTILETENLPLEALGGDRDAALAFAREVQMAILVSETSFLLRGVSGAPSLQTLSQNTYAAIATVISQAPPGPLNLGDPALMRKIILQAAANSNLTLNPALATGAGTIAGAVNTAINKLSLSNLTTYLSTLLQIQFVGQAAVAPRLQGISPASLTTFISQTTPATILTQAQTQKKITAASLDAIGPTITITPLEIAQVGGGVSSSSVTFQVQLSSPVPLTNSVSVQFATVDQTATAANGDYTPTSGTLTWLAGDTAPKTITVNVFASNASSVDGRFFSVALTNPVNARLELTQADASIIEEQEFATAITLQSSAPGASAGQPVTFTATVTNQDAGRTPGSGNVAFFDGKRLLGTVPLVGGVATLTASDLNVGDDTITASYAGVEGAAGIHFKASKAVLTQTIVRGSQTIQFDPIANVTDFDALSLDATATSGLGAVYTVVSGPAKLQDNILTFTGVGNVVIAANQPGDANFKAAPQVTQSFTVTHNTPTAAQELLLKPALATEGQKFTLTGHLTDPNAGDFLTLLIDWGDGTRQSFHPGTDSFAFNHQYAGITPGTTGKTAYKVHTTWFDQEGKGNSRDLIATVTDAKLDQPSNLALSQPINVAFVNRLLGTFRDGNVLNTDPTSFAGTISWGDGTSSSAIFELERVAGTGSIWMVKGSHKYVAKKTYAVTINLHETANVKNTLVVHASMDVK